MITIHTWTALPLLAAFITACGGDAPRDSDSSVATTPTASTATVDSAWIASPAGVGGVRTGMRRSALLGSIGQPSRAGYYSHDPCAYVGGTALPAGVKVMVSDSTVARIDVQQPGVPTLEGIEVGDSEASVLERYRGRVAVTPHKYSGPEWHYLTVTPPDDTLHRIVFETDGAVVKNYRVGRRPEVEWVEGCS